MKAPFTVAPNAKHLMQKDAPEAIVTAALRFWETIGRAEQRLRWD